MQFLHLKEGKWKSDWPSLSQRTGSQSMGEDLIFFDFELFSNPRHLQAIFPEVSLDIVEYASKPTIYQ